MLHGRASAACGCQLTMDSVCTTASFKVALKASGKGQPQEVSLVIHFVLKEKWPQLKLRGSSKWLDQMGRRLEEEK